MIGLIFQQFQEIEYFDLIMMSLIILSEGKQSLQQQFGVM